MQSQHEFLNGVWNKISQLEYEERQEQLANKRNAQLKKQTAIIYLGLTFLFVLFLFVNVDYIYIVCGLLLLSGYYLENNFEYKK